MLAYVLVILSLAYSAAADVACEAGGSGHACRAKKDFNGDHCLLQRQLSRTTASLDEGLDTQGSWTKSIKEKRDIAYAGTTDKKQQLDIYWPDAPVPHGGWLPVVSIHGMGSNKNAFRELCQIIARTGRLCVSIDYREDTKVMKDDASEALDWVMQHASAYNINKDKIIVYGQSRGGFITMNLLTNNKYDASRIAGAVLANGVGQTAYKYASKVKVPLLVVTAENDNIVPDEWSVAFVNELESIDADVSFVYYKSAGHNPRKNTGSLYEHVSKFLSKFENESPPTVGSVSDAWPQIGSQLKCFNSASIEIKNIDHAACQDEAIKAGHRYIQYSSSGKLCATSETCDSAIKFSSGWQVYWRPQGSTAPAPPSPPSKPSRKTCTTLKPTNPVWTQTRCQERCGNADKCTGSRGQCGKMCSAACPCGASR